MVPSGIAPPYVIRTASRALQQLIRNLGRYRGRIPIADLTQLMQLADVTPMDVSFCCRYDDRGYTRNLIHAGRHYELLCLCWKSGQQSTIHDHHESNCVVRVVQGVMTNTNFELLPAGTVRPLGSTHLLAGSIDARAEVDIHQISNLQPAGAALVTLHAYSPPLTSMRIFSLDTPFSRSF